MPVKIFLGTKEAELTNMLNIILNVATAAGAGVDLSVVDVRGSRQLNLSGLHY